MMATSKVENELLAIERELEILGDEWHIIVSVHSVLSAARPPVLAVSAY